MTKHARALLLWLLLLALPALACNLTSPPEPTQAPQATSIPPTNTPAPTQPPPTETTVPPTETPAPTPTLPPDPREGFIDYESEAFGLTFAYPPEWIVDESSGFIGIVSDPSILDSQDFSSGAGIILAVDPGMASMAPEEILDMFASPEGGLLLDVEVVSEPTSLLINGQDAVQATYLGTLEDQPVKATITVIMKEQWTAIAVALTPRAGDAVLEPLMSEIVSSIILVGSGSAQVEGNISLGQSVDGVVPANTASTWTFTAAEGETVNILVVPDEGLDAMVDVLDANGQSILPDGIVDESFDEEEIQGLILPAGTYTISVTGFASSAGKYTLSLASSTQNLSEAAPLAMGEALAGSLAADQAANYVFTGTAGVALNLRVTPDDELDVVVTLYDTAGKELQTTDASFGEESVLFTPDADGEYYAQVTSYDGSPGSFTISLEEGLAELPLIPDTILFSETGSVAADEITSYVVSAQQYRPMTIVVSSVEDFDAVVQVLDPNGDEVIEQDVSYDQEELLLVPLLDGDYQVNVTGFEGVAGSFDITVFPGGLGGVGVTGSVVAASNTLVDAEDSHAYPFTAISDQPVLAVVQPEAGLDVVLEVVNDDTGRVVQTIDNTFAHERVLFAPPTDGGNYYIAVSGYEGETGAYQIYLLGGQDIFFELASGDTVYATLGDDSFSGFTYSGLTDETLTVSVSPEADLDVVIEVEPVEGEPYLAVDDGVEGELESASYTFSSDETILVVVRGFNDDAGSYVMQVEVE
ncbi:MAG: hypothetical protein Fur0021_28210 [Candidatus Promineifilaceae bacterium]